MSPVVVMAAQQDALVEVGSAAGGPGLEVVCSAPADLRLDHHASRPVGLEPAYQISECVFHKWDAVPGRPSSGHLAQAVVVTGQHAPSMTDE
jgi:hypothetical protein